MHECPHSNYKSINTSTAILLNHKLCSTYRIAEILARIKFGGWAQNCHCKTRAQTPHAPSLHVINIISAASSNFRHTFWRPLPTHKRPVVCMSRRLLHINSGHCCECGYDDQQKYTICDACRPCHSIRSTVRPVFRQIWQICRTYELPRSLDIDIWQFFCWQWRQQRRQNPLLYPLRMHVG